MNLIEEEFGTITLLDKAKEALENYIKFIGEDDAVMFFYEWETQWVADSKASNLEEALNDLKDDSIALDVMTKLAEMHTETQKVNSGYYDMIVVNVEEEYGYRNWLWFTEMHAEELIEFWKEKKTVSDLFFHPEDGNLPGKLIELDGYDSLVKKINTKWSAHFHCDDDSWLRNENEKYQHKGYHACEGDNCKTCADIRS